MAPLTFGDKVRLKFSTRFQSVTMDCEVDAIFTIEDWRHRPGDPLSGMIRLRCSRGQLTSYYDLSLFERVS